MALDLIGFAISIAKSIASTMAQDLVDMMRSKTVDELESLYSNSLPLKVLHHALQSSADQLTKRIESCAQSEAKTALQSVHEALIFLKSDNDISLSNAALTVDRLLKIPPAAEEKLKFAEECAMKAFNDTKNVRVATRLEMLKIQIFCAIIRNLGTPEECVTVFCQKVLLLTTDPELFKWTTMKKESTSDEEIYKLCRKFCYEVRDAMLSLHSHWGNGSKVIHNQVSEIFKLPWICCNNDQTFSYCSMFDDGGNTSILIAVDGSEIYNIKFAKCFLVVKDKLYFYDADSWYLKKVVEVDEETLCDIGVDEAHETITFNQSESKCLKYNRSKDNFEKCEKSNRDKWVEVETCLNYTCTPNGHIIKRVTTIKKNSNSKFDEPYPDNTLLAVRWNSSKILDASNNVNRDSFTYFPCTFKPNIIGAEDIENNIIAVYLNDPDYNIWRWICKEENYDLNNAGQKMFSVKVGCHVEWVLEKNFFVCFEEESDEINVIIKDKTGKLLTETKFDKNQTASTAYGDYIPATEFEVSHFVLTEKTWFIPKLKLTKYLSSGRELDDGGDKSVKFEIANDD